MGCWLNEMPLDDPRHIRAAWNLIHRPVVFSMLTTLNGMTEAEAMDALEQARDRVQLAAIEHGMGAL